MSAGPDTRILILSCSSVNVPIYQQHALGQGVEDLKSILLARSLGCRDYTKACCINPLYYHTIEPRDKTLSTAAVTLFGPRLLVPQAASFCFARFVSEDCRAGVKSFNEYCSRATDLVASSRAT